MGKKIQNVDSICVGGDRYLEIPIRDYLKGGETLVRIVMGGRSIYGVYGCITYEESPTQKEAGGTASEDSEQFLEVGILHLDIPSGQRQEIRGRVEALRAGDSKTVERYQLFLEDAVKTFEVIGSKSEVLEQKAREEFFNRLYEKERKVT